MKVSPPVGRHRLRIYRDGVITLAVGEDAIAVRLRRPRQQQTAELKTQKKELISFYPDGYGVLANNKRSHWTYFQIILSSYLCQSTKCETNPKPVKPETR